MHHAWAVGGTRSSYWPHDLRKQEQQGENLTRQTPGAEARWQVQMVMLMGLEGEGNEHKLGWPRKAAWRRYSFRMDIRGQITEKPPSDGEGAGGTGYEQWGRYWR